MDPASSRLCYFLDVPVEVRLLIYEAYTKTVSLDDPSTTRSALVRTCKRVYWEMLPFMEVWIRQQAAELRQEAAELRTVKAETNPTLRTISEMLAIDAESLAMLRWCKKFDAMHERMVEMEWWSSRYTERQYRGIWLLTDAFATDVV